MSYLSFWQAVTYNSAMVKNVTVKTIINRSDIGGLSAEI